MSKALLFIDGKKPERIPSNINSYSLITCTDGAYSHYVKNLPLKINYISGDMDSVSISEIPAEIEIIYTPDQNKTDFHKALELLIERNITEVDIYGATGKETDHFIGNIATALYFKPQLRITFFDDYSKFFFSEKKTNLTEVKGKIISLIPFFEAKDIVTDGLKYSLHHEDLVFNKRVGTRNRADKNKVTITYSDGELLIYVGDPKTE